MSIGHWALSIEFDPGTRPGLLQRPGGFALVQPFDQKSNVKFKRANRGLVMDVIRPQSFGNPVVGSLAPTSHPGFRGRVRGLVSERRIAVEDVVDVQTKAGPLAGEAHVLA